MSEVPLYRARESETEKATLRPKAASQTLGTCREREREIERERERGREREIERERERESAREREGERRERGGGREREKATLWPKAGNKTLGTRRSTSLTRNAPPLNRAKALYRGTSLARRRTPLGPYRKLMPRVLGRS